MIPPDHRCNAYCHGNEHCTLIYADIDDRRALALAWASKYPECIVMRVAPAREAEPYASFKERHIDHPLIAWNGWQIHLLPGRLQRGLPYLVWYRLRAGAVS